MRAPLLALALSLSLASCGAPATAGVVDAELAEFLGAARLEVLHAPERVTSFRIDGDAATGVPEGDARERVSGWPLIAPGPELSDEQVARLSALVLEVDNYAFDMGKLCIFMPGVAVRFERGGSVVDVLLCFSCDEWSFALDGNDRDGERRVHEDFDPARGALVRLAQELFPDDEAIAGLK